VSPAPRFPSGPYIVVADENPELLDFMVAILRSANCCVYQAHDALAALEVTLGLGTIDLLITDASRPRIKGPQLIREVREKMPTLPILYIANRKLSNGTVPDGLPADVPTLREPFTASQLLAAARALLDGTRGQPTTIERVRERRKGSG
jgi:DNA-binding response OmpR family regulator